MLGALTACAGGDGAGPAVPATTSTTAGAVAPAPGAVVSSEPAGDEGALLVRYLSTGVDGDLVEVTGAVLVPEGEPPEGGWPVLAFAHGTTGTADACAPSLTPGLAGGAFADVLDQGFVVALTDYEGLGGPGVHPYLNGRSEARSVIDSVRAARALVPGTGTRWIAAGFSQGGHAAVFTAEEAAGYAAELELLGAVAYAPAAGLPAFPSLDGSRFGGFVALVLAGYVAATGVDPATILTPEGIDAVALADEACLGEMFDAVGADTLLLPGAGAAGTPLAGYLAANDTGQRATAVPLLVLQGEDDDVVPPALTESTVTRLCGLGDVVELRTYPGADHGSILDAADDDAGAWIADRLAGRPAPSTC